MLSLYLHIPFCHRICPYCSFHKHKPGGTDQGAFIEAILKEAKYRNDELGSPQFRTVYLGGGTPSLLSPTHLERLFVGLHDILDLSQVIEIDLEANPSTFDLRKACLLNDLGVTRVSLGIQSFQPIELSALGRDHSPEQAVESYHLLREAGISSVNIDFMFSVPHQTESTWQDTLDRALSLQPDHISCYNLTYEEDTAYFEQFKKGELSDDPDLNARLFTLAHDKLTAAGFRHYETSNYSRPGHHSKHNLSYWEGRPYLGLGPSAVSTLQAADGKQTRWKNVADTPAYIRQIDAVGHAMTEIENLTPEQFALERIALLLRTDTGLPRQYLPPHARLDALLEEELATLSDSHLALTREGALLVDSIAEHLLT
ncbi:MAG: radical SAM family heme chaperone HemW [Verrucomicrobiota bacterium JB023]|nr:radical SAM family heme chaperone HemW [Verrucomicrobiota bacterium JB023]